MLTGTELDVNTKSGIQLIKERRRERKYSIRINAVWEEDLMRMLRCVEMYTLKLGGSNDMQCIHIYV